MTFKLQNKNYFEWLAYVTIALFVTTFVDNVSPVNTNYEYDFSIFLYFGQSWANGNIPFLEVFDHKGPFQFVVYLWATYLAPGKLGVYILHTLWLVAILKLTMSIIRLLIPHNRYFVEYLILLLGALFYIFTFDVGFTCEAISLPFTLLPLYLTVQFLSKRSPLREHPYTYSLIYGVCIAIVFLVRPNNGVINCGLIIGLIIQYLRSKEFKSLFLNGIVLAGGFAAVVAPTLLYFYCVGALEAMIEGAYIFNFAYMGGSEANVQANLVKMLPAFYLILLSLLYDRRFETSYSPYLVPSSILMILVYATSNGFGHYFLSMQPIYIMALILSYNICKDNVSRILLGFFLLFSLLNIGVAPYIVKLISQNITWVVSKGYRTHNDHTKEIDKFLAYIPVNERDQVYSYGTHFRIQSLIRGNIIVDNRFFFRLGFPDYEPFDQAMDDYHNTTTVKWIVSRVDRESAEKESFKQLLNNYELIYSEPEGGHLSRLYLYKRK